MLEQQTDRPELRDKIDAILTLAEQSQEREDSYIHARIRLKWLSATIFAAYLLLVGLLSQLFVFSWLLFSGNVLFCLSVASWLTNEFWNSKRKFLREDYALREATEVVRGMLTIVGRDPKQSLLYIEMKIRLSRLGIGSGSRRSHTTIDSPQALEEPQRSGSIDSTRMKPVA